MRESAVELCVGDSIRIDDYTVTVIDVSGDEITFRIDQDDDFAECGQSSSLASERLLPR